MCLEDGLLNQFHYRREKNEKKANEIVMMAILLLSKLELELNFKQSFILSGTVILRTIDRQRMDIDEQVKV